MDLERKISQNFDSFTEKISHESSTFILHRNGLKSDCLNLVPKSLIESSLDNFKEIQNYSVFLSMLKSMSILRRNKKIRCEGEWKFFRPCR